jgi:hypothetical protein
MAVISNGTTLIDNGSFADNSVDTAELAAASVEDAKINTGLSSSKLTGTLPAIDGSALTGISASPFSATSITTSNFSSGYVKFTNGYTIQWAKAASNTDNTTFTFPLTFSNVFSIIGASFMDSNFKLSSSGNIYNDSSTSTSSFSIKRGTTTSGGFYYIAVGYVS